MALDPSRHQRIFCPYGFGERRIDVIGAGATGSAVAFSLAKHGVRNLHVWDDDRVEDHNLSNQIYGPKHVGQLKVEALRDVILELCDLTITIHPERVFQATKVPAEFVFLLVDSMAGRKDIAAGLRYNARTRFCFETRMGARHGHLFAFDPARPGQYGAWVQTLWTDAEIIDPSVCNAPVSVGATAQLLASLAVLAFIDAAQERLTQATETFISTQPLLITTRDLEAPT